MDVRKLISNSGGRDYTLTGAESRSAIEAGLAGAEWYRTPLDRRELKRLMERSDGPALRDTAIWFALLALTAAGGVTLWGSMWAVPVFLAYGVLYGSVSDSRWHECGHGTAFRTSWMNNILYEVASFMMMRNPVVWRWSHARHHTDTIIVGRDPEIAGMRPPRVIMHFLNLFGLIAVPKSFVALLRNAAGRFTPNESDFVPEAERPGAVRAARLHMLIYAAALTASLASGSFLPLMLIGLPRFYGGWLLLLMGLTQHLGLAEDVLDHRLNSRTVLMNPVLRFLYWNMNYHIEHHMYPMVPYHSLPQLHEAVKHDLPEPACSLWRAWAEILPTVLRQLGDPAYHIRPTLPEGAGAPRFGPDAHLGMKEPA